MLSFTGHVYNVERKDRPGEILDQEALLSRYEETEFYIARQNSRRVRGAEKEGDPTKGPTEGGEQVEEYDARLMHQISVLEAPVYQEYHGIYMITNRYI